MELRSLQSAMGAGVLAIICLIYAFRGIVLREVPSAIDGFPSVVILTGHDALVVGLRWLGGAIACGAIASLFVWLHRRD